MLRDELLDVHCDSILASLTIFYYISRMYVVMFYYGFIHILFMCRLGTFLKPISFFLQLEDDVVAKPGFFSVMKAYADEQKENDWILLEFSALGFIGRFPSQQESY